MHTYAVEWDDGRRAPGTSTARSTAGSPATRSRRSATGPSTGPFYLILNLAIGGVLGGEVPDSLTFPQELVVDWVRVYA